jgi:hypothetical protein
MTGPADLFSDLDRLDGRLGVLERRELAPFREVRDSEGRLRTRYGLQTDGSYGLRVWNTAGVLVHNLTA